MTPTCGLLQLITGPDASLDPLSLAVVRDQHLRSAIGDEADENAYVTRLMTASWRRAERKTRRALFAQQWRLSLDRFPVSGVIVLPKPPLQSVDSITYVDEDGVEQTWGGSPLPYVVQAPSGPTAGYAMVRLAYDGTWPTARCQPGAVTVTFTCGYPATGSPAVADVPEDITHGRLLFIGELYKQRSESVHAFNQNPAVISADSLWLQYRAY